MKCVRMLILEGFFSFPLLKSPFWQNIFNGIYSHSSLFRNAYDIKKTPKPKQLLVIFIYNHLNEYV